MAKMGSGEYIALQAANIQAGAGTVDSLECSRNDPSSPEGRLWLGSVMRRLGMARSPGRP